MENNNVNLEKANSLIEQQNEIGTYNNIKTELQEIYDKEINEVFEKKIYDFDKFFSKKELQEILCKAFKQIIYSKFTDVFDEKSCQTYNWVLFSRDSKNDANNVLNAIYYNPIYETFLKVMENQFYIKHIRLFTTEHNGGDFHLGTYWNVRMEIIFPNTFNNVFISKYISGKTNCEKFISI